MLEINLRAGLLLMAMIRNTDYYSAGQQLNLCLFLSCCVSATCNGELIPDLLVKLLSRDRSTEMQMSAAKW